MTEKQALEVLATWEGAMRKLYTTHDSELLSQVNVADGLFAIAKALDNIARANVSISCSLDRVAEALEE